MISPNPNARLEMFSDGVFAIAITILVLEIKVPPLESIHSLADLWQQIFRLWPSFFALSLTFIIILISWVGHHNMLDLLDKTSPQFQFANGFFLFTLMFLPFPTAFMAEYLNTTYAQPAILLYCLGSTLHNLGWNVLHIAIAKPVLLVKDGITVDHIKKYRRGAQIGFVINIGIVLLSWWLPYVAIVLSLLIWIYWLILSVSVRRSHQV